MTVATAQWYLPIDGGEAYSMGMQERDDLPVRRVGFGPIRRKRLRRHYQEAEQFVAEAHALHNRPVGELEGDSPTGSVITSTPEEQQ